ncbi:MULTISPECIES: hypothetical protein [Alteromonas]|uniref:Permuted papain-like amidase YaeF/Yiix C92 family enzyme n=1 Tax=Alteromonas stellipolaris TaxID=233316 RepID=A0ABM5YGV9_9ALTE|nr:MULTISPECIES: hypothetical protein [Alteromonas]ALM91633.1 hypothetical protein AOR13_2628 [Alteromonas stellipolaris LMG 21856]AMJ73494.1 hypothetical protein AVL57_05600 [Alteromonas stellipolaris]MBQ4828680.1 hypothetical protein [Alteromonas sp. MMG017]|mmetsp:Transcript_8232/g.21024  ORF Transcript_8232/g.21024 Transcript_8232/m.21024 type:complete len:220 (+) Transcript_8232:133-792(+)
MLEQQKYHHIREQMRPGDIIAFGGNSLFSRWTKLTTRSAVTHIAIVMQTKMRDEASGRYFNQVMEATVYEGKKGVMTNRLSERVHTYDGDMWWLPLGESARNMFEQNKREFFNFMFAQEGKAYDVLQLFGSAVDALDSHPILGSISYNQEDFSSWFCSELIAEGLETAGIINSVNASEVTPVDICRFSIFEQRYVQLKGEARPIAGFNTQLADNWGQVC